MRTLHNLVGLLSRWSNKALNWILPDRKSRADTRDADGAGTANAEAEVGADGVASLARWLASGFTLLVGLLGFFGVKDDVLDRALVDEPRAAMLVFCQVGGAVIAAVAVAVLPTRTKIRSTFLVVAVTALVVVSWRVYPDIGDLAPDLSVWVVGAVTAIGVVVITFAARISVTAFTLILATTSLVLGMYGAAKLGVQTAAFTTDIEVTAEVTRVDGEATATVELDVTAGGLHAGDALRVIVFNEDVIDRSGANEVVRAEETTSGTVQPAGGTEPTISADPPSDTTTTTIETSTIARYDRDLVLGEAILVPDLGGQISHTAKFLVPASVERGSVRVVRCEVQRAPTGTLPGGLPIVQAEENLLELVHCPNYLGSSRALFAIAAGDPVTATTTTTTQPAGPTPTLTATVTAADPDQPADVTVTAANAPPGAIVEVDVARGGATVATSRLHIGNDGSVSWTVPVGNQPGATVTVTATLTAPDAKLGDPPITTHASYLAPD